MENNCSSSVSQTTANKPIVCRAAVCRKAGEPLVIEQVEVAPPGDWEVRIKVICTSLCHTDVTFWKITDGPFRAAPRIYGHEAVGVVESVGEHVKEMKAGDTVVPVFQPHCGECRDCKSKKSNMCKKFTQKHTDVTPRDPTGKGRFKDMNGDTIYHFLNVSSFVEYTVIDVVHVVKIPSLMPLDKACLLSCGVSTGVGAAWKVAEVEHGSTVAVFGLGAVGLAVAEGAKRRGASMIIGVDLNPDKFEIGKKFGVTHFINPKCCDGKSISQVIKELTDGGADYCFECIGISSLMQQAFESSREGWGKTIILGVDMGGNMSLSSFEFLQGKSIMGCFFGGMKPKIDVPILAQKYIDQELSLDGFITHQIGLDDINEAFDLLQQGKSIRCIIWMDINYAK